MLDEYLIRLENHLKDIKNLLKNMQDKNEPNLVKTLNTFSYTPNPTTEFEDLKKLLYTEEWSEAVDPDLIHDPNSIDEKQLRAENIIDFIIEEPLENKKFLDFGCGDGFCAGEALRKGASLSIGYDIKFNPNFSSEGIENDTILTDSWEIVEANKPYDIVMLFDVLDHIQDNPVEALKKIKSVCHTKTNIYVRCHPWCSKSAAHLYYQLNKAYLQIIFTDQELINLDLKLPEYVHSIIHPKLIYNQWFTNAGLLVIEDHVINEEIGDFFQSNPLVVNKIKNHWKPSHEPDLASGERFPSYQLAIQFLDFKLALKSPV